MNHMNHTDHMNHTNHMNHTSHMNHTKHECHNGAGGHGGNGHGMKMYFYIGNEVTILFEEWKIDSNGGIIWSMIIIFLLGIIYEGLKVGREALKRREFRTEKVAQASYQNGQNSTGSAEKANISFAMPRHRLLKPFHLLQTLLHMVQVFLGYLLMLAFMTYNTWICLAVILGSGCGYFLFGWHRNSVLELSDHCF